MHRPLSAAARVAWWLALGSTALAGAPEPLEKARACLERNEGAAAAALLEEALPAASAENRPPGGAATAAAVAGVTGGGATAVADGAVIGGALLLARNESRTLSRSSSLVK